MGKYFGTDGIRKKSVEFNKNFVNGIVTPLIKLLKEENDTPTILIGGDTRESTKTIIETCMDICIHNGAQYINIGVMPTPSISYLTTQYHCDGAIVVTASHNPSVDNGIKILNKNGEKLDDNIIEKLESYMDDYQGQEINEYSTYINSHDEAKDKYIKYLSDIIKTSLKGLKIGIDCANGATSVIAKDIFKMLDAELMVINEDSSYGDKINDGCGSTHMEAIQKLVIENNLDFGCSFDGDGDRCLMVDNEGNVIDGDQIIAIIAESLRENRKLNDDKIAITIMANQGLMIWAKENNINTEVTKVGDTYVYEAMKKYDISLGGEQSGHIIMPNQKTGDGILTGLTISEIVENTNKSLKDLASVMNKYPQIIRNMYSDDIDKEIFKKDEVQLIVKEYDEMIKNENGKLLIRASGTEELIRITIWGEDIKKITDYAEEIEEKLKNKINTFKR